MRKFLEDGLWTAKKMTGETLILELGISTHSHFVSLTDWDWAYIFYILPALYLKKCKRSNSINKQERIYLGTWKCLGEFLWGRRQIESDPHPVGRNQADTIAVTLVSTVRAKS